MKKILIIFLLGMFMISFVPAYFEFDNYYSYNESSRIATFKNGLTFGSKIADIRLNTPLDMGVAPGYNYVFELEIWGNVDYSDFVRGIYVHDKKNDYNLVNRDIDIKYLNGYETKYRDIKGCISEGFSPNGTRQCMEYGVVSTEAYQSEVWDNLLPRDLKENDHLIVRGYTHVQVGEKMEWYIDFFGAGQNTEHGTKGVKEWAVWTADLNVGLFTYYKLNETSGAVLDSVGNNNGTNNGATTGDVGIINNSYNFDGTNDYINSTGFASTTGDYTFSFWLNPDDTAGFQVLFDDDGGDAGDRLFFYTAISDNNIGFNDGTGASSFGVPVIVGAWNHYVFVFNSSSSIAKLYINATEQATTPAYTSISLGNAITLGVAEQAKNNPYDGGMDELAFYNRSLTSEEITQLYNNGTGITFTDDFVAVTLNSPADDFISNDPEVIFNASVETTGDETIVNISLYTNDSGTFQIKKTHFIVGGINNTATFLPTENKSTVSTNEEGFFVSVKNFTINSLIENITGNIFVTAGDAILNVTYVYDDDSENSTAHSTGSGTPDPYTSTNPEQSKFVSFVRLFLIHQNQDGLSLENDTTINIIGSIETFSEIINESIIWNVEACDSDDNCEFGAQNRTLNIDTTLPQITIIHPVGNEGVNAVGFPQDLNWSVNDTNLDSCWFDYNGTNTTVTCSDNSTTFILEENNLNLTFYANDTVGNENSSFTEWFYTFLESSLSFNNTAFETSTQSFILNITTLSDILTVDAILNYDSTRFTTISACILGSCSISTAIDIPLVTSGENENKSFFFEITGFNATSSFSVNSSTRQQNVTRIHLEECNATFTTETLNFTAFDEITLAGVDPFSFNANFEFWLGTGTIFRNNSFSEPSISSIQLCILPSNFTYNINGVIEYDEATGTNYTIRNYYFQQDQINNNSEDIGLGLLLADQSTTFILKVQDADILPLPDALIFTERFYPGTGEFLVVQVAKTDDNGKSVGFFEAETGDYRFIIKKNGVTLLITPADNRSQKVVGEEVPFTLTFTVGEDEGASWEDFEPVDDLISNLTYDTTTQILSFIYSDTSDDFSSALLQVFKINSTGDDSLVCNNNLTQSSGIIICNMTGNVTGNYIAKGIIFRGEVRVLAEQIIFTIEDFTSQAGRLGLFLGWFVILITALTFKFNEIAGIILTNIAMIFVNLIGLLNFGITWITAWVAISIIILVILER